MALKLLVLYVYIFDKKLAGLFWLTIYYRFVAINDTFHIVKATFFQICIENELILEMDLQLSVITNRICVYR